MVESRRLVKDCDCERLMRRGVQGVAAGVERRLLDGPQEEVGAGFRLLKRSTKVISTEACTVKTIIIYEEAIF